MCWMALTLQGSLSVPVLQAGDDISAEQVAALRSGQVPGQNTEQSSTTGATGGTDTAGTTVDEDGSVTTSSDTGSKSRASSWSLNAFWLASAALFQFGDQIGSELNSLCSQGVQFLFLF